MATVSENDAFQISIAQSQPFVEAVPAIAWPNEPDGSVTRWNQRWLDYTGQTIEASRGSGWQNAIHPDDRFPFSEKWRFDLNSGQPGEVEVRLQQLGGNFRWFLLRYEPAHDSNGRIVEWHGIGIDTDDRKRAELKLRQDEQQFRTITDLIAQNVAVVVVTASCST